jgi:hypothetical protein
MKINNPGVEKQEKMAQKKKYRESEKIRVT